MHIVSRQLVGWSRRHPTSTAGLGVCILDREACGALDEISVEQGDSVEYTRPWLPICQLVVVWLRAYDIVQEDGCSSGSREY